MASIEVLLRGSAITSSEGNFAPCAVYLVRAEGVDGRQRVIVYDFGHVGRRMKLMRGLERRGIDPATVDTVVVSHSHWDHLQNVDLFPSAEIVVDAAELEYAASPAASDHATPSWSGLLIDRARVHLAVDGEELASGVRVIRLPGHTPGSIGLVVETEQGVAVLAGDAVASASAAERAWCPNVFWDAGEADESVAKILELADLVYPGHDRPFRLHDGKAEYITAIRPVTISVSGIPSGDVTVEDRPVATERNLMGRAKDVAEHAASGASPT
jgi:N-acyl homoserine lactone hydrolase